MSMSEEELLDITMSCLADGDQLDDFDDDGAPNTTNGTQKLLDIPLVVGFQTASGKPVLISEKALAAAKALFKDDLKDDDDDIDDAEQLASRKRRREDPEHEKSKDSTAPLVNGNNHNAADMNEEELLDITMSCLADGDQLDDFDDDGASNTTKEPQKLIDIPLVVGFQTASGKPVPISEKALAAAKELFKDDLKDDDDAEQLRIRKRKREDPEHEKSKDITVPLLNGNNHNPTDMNEEELLDITMSCLADGDDLNDFEDETPSSTTTDQSQPLDIPLVVRFQTASGKPVPITEKALAAAKELFKDDLKDDDEQLTSRKRKREDDPNI